MGSSRPRNSTHAERAHSTNRAPRFRRADKRSPDIPVALENVIDDQRRELVTIITLLRCLHLVLRYQAENPGQDESSDVTAALGWVELPDITSMLLRRVHSVHLALDSASLKQEIKASFL